MFQGYIFDLDGTVYLRAPDPRRRKKQSAASGTRAKVVFLSNKPLYTREDYAAKLTSRHRHNP